MCPYHVAKVLDGTLKVRVWAEGKNGQSEDYAELFTLVNKNTTPEVTRGGSAPWQPLSSYSDFESKAAHYEGLGALKDQQRPIVSRSDLPLARFSIVRSADEAESARPDSRFFYTDNEHAFCVEPMVAEVLLQHVKTYGVRMQEPVAFNKELMVMAKAPRMRVEQFERDEHATFELRGGRDWLADKATVLVYDGRRIGPNGALDGRTEIDGR